MQLMRLGPSGQERPAVRLNGGPTWDVSDVFADYDQDFFANNGIAHLNDLIAERSNSLSVVAVDSVRIGAPIAKPYQVLCIGLNYAEHARESGMPTPNEPVVFNKAPSTIVGPNDDVLIPPRSLKTDWEVELAVVIGTEARYLGDVAAAGRCIAGYAISNDVSERAFQLERGGQCVKGKSCETFNPLGPWLATAEEIANPQNLQLSLRLNDEVMQDGRTSDMIFGVHHIVWYLSQFMTLEPGDVVNTGTPLGVGMGQSPPRYLRDGDVMELGIDGLGIQRQTVRDPHS